MARFRNYYQNLKNLFNGKLLIFSTLYKIKFVFFLYGNP